MYTNSSSIQTCYILILTKFPGKKTKNCHLQLVLLSLLCMFQVGGIKEKVLAAHRAGLRRIILPKRNEKDLQDIPNNVKVSLQLVSK